jgi:hypothetical protein
MGGDHVGGLVADDALGLPERHRLREGVDVLVLDLLVDDRRQQAGGQPGVVGLLRDERRRGPDGEVVQVLGRGAVHQTRDGAGGDTHRIDVVETLGATCDRTHDLVQVDRLQAAVALAHPHLGAQVPRPGRLHRRLVDDLDLTYVLGQRHRRSSFPLCCVQSSGVTV